MKTVMTKDYQAPAVNIQRTSFNRSHGHKTTFDADMLVPVYWDEVLPGDTFKMQMHGFARMSTPIYPIMDNLKMQSFFFFVPMRLVWNNTEQFFGEDAVGGDGSSPVKPMRATPTGGGYTSGSLGDYLGIPLTIPNIDHDELPMRAYYEVWNEWFRDQNLQEKVIVEKGDLPNTQWGTVPGLRRRNKKQDYFTSCLPWPQKGPDVAIPMMNVDSSAEDWSVEHELWKGLTSGTLTGHYTDGVGNSVLHGMGALSESLVPNARAWNENAGTINQWRYAIAVQHHYEKDARGGTRYPELIKSQFGVTSADARLQRPEYLGGGSNMVNITPVAQTYEDPAATTGDRTVGDLGAMGTLSAQNHGFTKSFTEHGFILGLINITGDITYQEGLDRAWTRTGRFSYFWPSFANVGEQPVRTSELYKGTESDTVFGYQERYAEYRYKRSMITGEFRSLSLAPLDAWHLAQQFGTEPFLNDEFIKQATPMGRVLATPEEPHFIGDFYFQLTSVRPIPLYGTPGLTRF